MANHALAAPEPKRMEVLQHIRTLLNQHLRSEMERLAGPKPSSHYEERNAHHDGHEYITPTVCYGTSGNFKNAGRWFSVCTRPDHLKKGLSCRYPQFLSKRPSSIAMERLQESFLLYCLTGTKWGTTPYPELEVFTEYLTHATSNPTPYAVATAQQPTPPNLNMVPSKKFSGKKRARSPTSTPAPTGKKTKYDFIRIEPSTNITPVAAHSTAGNLKITSMANAGKRQPNMIFDSKIIEISDSD